MVRSWESWKRWSADGLWSSGWERLWAAPYQSSDPTLEAQLTALVEPSALAMMAGMIVAWVVSHAVGLGEIIDIIALMVGVVSARMGRLQRAGRSL
jgi:hypothetical protein